MKKLDSNGNTKSLRIIFCDIDGVLATGDTYMDAQKELDGQTGTELNDQTLISKDCIAALNKLIDATDAKVVISSAWRYGKDIEYFQKLFMSRGFIGEVIGKTPEWKDYKDKIGIKFISDLEYFWEHERGNEINIWLDRNKNELKSFIIIDDEPSDIRPVFPDNLLVTDFENGFREEHIEDAIKILETDYGRRRKENVDQEGSQATKS